MYQRRLTLWVGFMNSQKRLQARLNRQDIIRRMKRRDSTMTQLKLTGIARLNVHGIVTGKRYEDFDDSVMWSKFGKQIKLPADLLRTLISPVTNPQTGQKDINEIAIEKLTAESKYDITVEVEFGVTRKLITRLEEWAKEFKLSPADADWYMPLVAELKAMKDPAG